MNQEIAKLAEFLAGTLKEDNEARKAAEQNLLIISKNTAEYLNSLIQVIVSSHPDISSQIKSSAALAVKRLIKELSELQIRPEERLFYVSSIFSALTSDGLDSLLRGTLGYALVPLFSGQTEILTSFMPYLTQAMAGTTSSVYGSIRAIRSIYGGFVLNPVLYSFFKRILPNLLTIAKASIGLFSKSIGENNQVVSLECVEVLNEWATTVNTIFEYFDITCKDYLNEVKDFSDLSDVFQEIIMIILPDSGLTSPSLVNITATQISIKLNQTKSQLLSSINVVIQHLMDNRKKIAEKEQKNTFLTPVSVELAECPFLNLVGNLLSPIVWTLQAVINSVNFNKIIELEYISEIFIEMIFIVQKACSDNRFLSYFAQNYTQILINICLPMIMSSEADLETFKDSPEEFVSLSADVCERQESETVKSTAAGLLEILCQKVDGCLKYFVMFSRSLISSVLSQSNPQEFQESVFLKSPNELKIETSLLSLCIVSFLVAKRLDLTRVVEDIITENFNQLYSNGTALIKNRVIMTIQYYSEYIFQDEEEAFKSLLLIVLNSCDPNKVPVPSVNFQASETLSRMLQEEEVVNRIYQYIPEVIGSIISLIDYQDSKPFFEALQEIITTNTNLVLPNISVLVTSLVNKVTKETEKRRNKKTKTSIVIVKCWNIIRHLVEHKSLTKEQVLELEIFFVPLFKYIENPKEIEFDDDIILFEVSVMRRCEMVTEIGWQIFRCLDKVQEKYDNTFVQLFQILNSYIHYGRDNLLANRNYLNGICEMCGKCMFAIYKNKINEATNAEGALIFHQILFTFPNSIDELVPPIINFAMLKLRSVIRQDFFKARVLGIILAAFSYSYSLTLSFLCGNVLENGDSYLKYVMSEIIVNTQIFRHPYDKKIAVNGLCNFLVNCEGADQLTVFQIIIEILSNSWKDVINFNSSAKSDISEINLKESLKEFNSEELESSLALTTFLHPLSEYDEYEFFKSMVKGFSPEGLRALVSRLDQGQVVKLTNILQSKRVHIGNNLNQTDVRRIVKPKHHLHN